MEILDLRQDIRRDPVGQILTYEGRSIALVDLGRDASDALRTSWSTARPFQSGGVIESAWLLPMLGVGSTTASSLFAGNVFLATANPATLMTIGTGVGSAVMGPDRDRRCCAVRCRQRGTDTGCGTNDAFHHRLVGDDVRAPRPRAEDSRPAL